MVSSRGLNNQATPPGRAKPGVEGALNIIVVDSDADRCRSVCEALTENGDRIVATLADAVGLAEHVARLRPEAIIVDTNHPDKRTLEEISQVSASFPTPVVMFALDDKSDTIQTAIRAGVSAYVVDGLDCKRLKSIVQVAIARFSDHEERLRQSRSTSAELEKRKIIERAKGVIMVHQNCDEAQAHRILQRQAMDHRQNLAQAADDVLSGTADRHRTRR